jgi:hypothetical protein
MGHSERPFVGGIDRESYDDARSDPEVQARIAAATDVGQNERPKSMNAETLIGYLEGEPGAEVLVLTPEGYYRIGSVAMPYGGPITLHATKIRKDAE